MKTVKTFVGDAFMGIAMVIAFGIIHVFVGSPGEIIFGSNKKEANNNE